MTFERETWGVLCVVAAVGAVIGAGVWVDGAARGADRSRRRPSSDAEVLAGVRVRAVDPSSPARERLQRRLREDRGDLAAATELARLEIETARSTGDLRSLGRAEAALAAWWDAERPPEPALLLRATIRQARHEFDAALADLDDLLAAAPDHEQALLTRAVVLGVLGRHAAALESCDRLARTGSAFVVAACRAPLLGETGRAREGARALSEALGLARSPGEQAWGLSLLGELARWLGDDGAAETYLRAALARRPDDRYTRGVLATLLRDTGRGDEVGGVGKGGAR
jgi:tetratricopeptide (TPR) repeat protein